VSDREELNRPVIKEFRANAGVLGGRFAGVRMLLLTCRGARTGQPRILPLSYLPDGETFVVFGANGGRDAAPAWLTNLNRTPQATIEVDTRTIDVVASIVTGAERDRLWQAQVTELPWFAGFQQATERPIPVVALTPR
jgi:deazaflavin-dependent oxidoreductase (nitroreductase family)